MADETIHEAVIHGVNVDKIEQAKFDKSLTFEEIKQLILSGSQGKKVLLSKKEDPDENVVVEYK